MKSVPDLPQLEAVDVPFRATWNALESSSRFGWILSAFYTVLAYEFMFKKNHAWDAYVTPVLIAALILLGLYALFVAVHRWHADERGLTVHRFLRQKSIAWSDVCEVKSIRTLSRAGWGYLLVTSGETVRIPLPAAMERPYALLIGSIRQHLDRFGKADVIEFPKELSDLIWEIPDFIPQEVSWTNAYPQSLGFLRALVIIMAVLWLTLVGLSLGIPGWPNARVAAVVGVVFLGFLMAILWSELREQMSFATNATVSPKGIEVESGFGKASFHWEDVSGADWKAGGSVLAIRGRGKTVRIPSHMYSIDLILALLRGLRSMSQFETIAIPMQIRMGIDMGF